VSERSKRHFRVLLAQPRGFCAGVERAIEIVERALKMFGPPVYVRHEIVHNKHVVESLRNKGAVFVEELSDIPDGAVTIFSAHGVSDAVAGEAERRNLPVIDATCPLVSRVHKEGRNHAEQGREVILIGHEGHPEVEGTQGRIPGGVHLISSAHEVSDLGVEDGERLAYVTQTTLSVDETRDIITALKDRFPSISGPDVKDICYATQNRQTAVRKLADHADILLVVGAKNSSNSNRLREIGDEIGIPSYLIDDADGFDPSWLDGVCTIGVTAGASAPEELVLDLIYRLDDFGRVSVEEVGGIQENLHFKLPRSLEDAATQINASKG
jgi:4-hydroxy-3-methylbut-2-en-1-yl diphosphate reductase